MMANAEKETFEGSRPRWGIALAALASFLAGATISFVLTGHLMVTGAHRMQDLWFEADTRRVFDNLTNRHSDHHRTSVHPLTSLLLSTPTIAIKQAGIPADVAARATSAVGAGLLSLAFFLLVFRLLRRVLDALLFTALLMSSAAFIFFTGVMELYVWGAASILIALLLGVVRGRFSLFALVIAGVVSLGVTVTNWMAGLAASLVREGAARTVVIGAVSFAIVAALSAVQGVLYPTAGKFMNFQREADYIHLRPEVRLFHAPGAFFVDGVVAGTTTFTDGERPTIMLDESFVDMPAVGYVAAAGWVLLIVSGLVTIVRRWRRSPEGIDGPLLTTIGLVVIGQFVLHILYGDGFFLYSLHFVPLLIVVASLATLGGYRRVVLPLVVVVTILCGWHNWTRLEDVRVIAADATAVRDERLITERGRVLRAMTQRPDDPWPRGTGHVVVGQPGSREVEKAYLEPGGSFSPAVGSFGVSFWLRDDRGLLSSDALPLDQIQQEWIGFDGLSTSVGVRTRTPFYALEWRQSNRSEWELSIDPSVGDRAVEIVIRSVGPAGGPIHSLEVADDGLWINGRWHLESIGGVELIDVGPEGVPDWTGRRHGGPQAACPDGWCAARLTVRERGGLRLRDTEALPPLPSRLAGLPLTPGTSFQGIDPVFVEALEAQVGQILMGTVGDQTRPGEPTNYPLAWARDGAFAVVALVRAGRLDAAEVLIDHFAHQDFFGGFGAEADGPGLSLWAIGLVSRAKGDVSFDRRMWPHVFRKASLIESMRTTAQTMTAGFDGPIVPRYKGRDFWLLADPASAGLINGRMDWHRPRVFVSAVSVRGLQEAVRIARVLGEQQWVDGWTRSRDALETSVRAAISAGVELDNTRSLAVAIDPTGVATGVPAFREALEANWRATRDEAGSFRTVPLWTYFELAKARQWLHLGQPERARLTLDWFWQRSPAPGLYALWEGNGEENSLLRWPNVRGWVAPPHVTPHYWASAEMLLTQLSMLALIDNGRVVIGAGVPSAWLGRPMSVRGVVTELGPVSWTWDGDRLVVDFCGDPTLIQLAGAFESAERIVRGQQCASPSVLNVVGSAVR